MTEGTDQEQAAMLEESGETPGLSEPVEISVGEEPGRLISTDDIVKARTTAGVILDAMQQLAGRVGATTKSKYDGPKPEYYTEPIAQMAQAIRAIAELIEVYAELSEED